MKRIYSLHTIKKMIITILFFCTLPVMAQQKKIEGIVVDKRGEALFGGHVYSKYNEQNYTFSDLYAQFSLNLSSPADSVIVFKYIGYKTQEIKIKELKKRHIKVILQEDEQRCCDPSYHSFINKHIGKKENKEAIYINGYKLNLKDKTIAIHSSGDFGDKTPSQYEHFGKADYDELNPSPYTVFGGVDYDKQKLVVIDFISFFTDKSFDHQLFFKLREDKEFALEYAKRQSELLLNTQDSIDGFRCVSPHIYEKNGFFLYNDHNKPAISFYLDNPIIYAAENIYVSPEFIYIFCRNYAGWDKGWHAVNLYLTRTPYLNGIQQIYGEIKDAPYDLSDIDMENLSEKVKKDRLQLIKYPTGEHTYYATDGHYLLYENKIIDKKIKPEKLIVVNSHFIRSGDNYYIRDKKVHKKDLFIEIACP